MSKQSTPREIARKTSPILSVLSGVGTFVLLQALDAIHLWALALLVALLTETATFLIIKWSAETFISSKVKGVSMAISSVEDSDTPKAEHESLDDIIEWANDQVQDIKTLRKKDSFRKEFIGNLAHELKTPLFNIQGFVLTLMENDLKDEALVRNFLTKANKNVDRMTELIEDLDAISKLESDRIEMTLVPCNVVDLMREALENAEVAAEKKKIALKLELPAPTEQAMHVLCSPHHMQQVLTNLVANSIHYGKENGTSTLKLKDNGRDVTLSVADDGIGIAADDLGRIFERFYRVDKSRSRHAGGSGLGLSIVKHIIESHGQEISVASAPGQGTTFSWNLVNLDWEAEKLNLTVPPPSQP